MIRIASTALAGLFLACGDCAPAAAAGEETAGFVYRVEGRFTNTFKANNDPEAFRFDLTVSNRNWMIVTTPVGRSADSLGIKVESYIDSVADGVMYRYVTLDAGGSGKKFMNTSTGVIEYNDLPFEKSVAIPVWLAFASTGYLPAGGEGRLRALWDDLNPDARWKTNTVAATWEMEAAPPGLPREIRYLNDGWFYSLDLKGRPVRDRYDPPYHNGYVHRTLKCGAFTNVGGLAFPLEFSLETFFPATGGAQTNDVFRWFHCAGRAETISLEIPSTTFVPSTDGKTRTTERRFAGAKAPIREFAYMNTNAGGWPEAGKPRLLAIYSNALEHAALVKKVQPPGEERPSSSLITVVFVLLVLLPPVYILGRRMRSG